MSEFQEDDVDHEAPLPVLWRDVARLKRTIYGNGKAGMEEVLRVLVTQIETRKDIEEKQHAANTARLNIIIGILIAIAAYIAIVVSLRTPARTSLDPMNIFHSQTKEEVVMYLQQPHVYAGGTGNLHY